MRAIVMLVMFAALMVAFTGSAQAYPNCTQVAERCQEEGDCLTRIQWGSYCDNNLRTWRCCWKEGPGGPCDEICFPTWSLCHCDTPEGVTAYLREHQSGWQMVAQNR